MSRHDISDERWAVISPMLEKRLKTKDESVRRLASCSIVFYGFWRLCPRKWLMLFSLKFQRNNRQNALAMDSAKRENPEKKSAFSLCWGDEATVCYDRARRDTPRKGERDFRTSIPLPQEWPPPQRDSHSLPPYRHALGAQKGGFGLLFRRNVNDDNWHYLLEDTNDIKLKS